MASTLIKPQGLVFGGAWTTWTPTTANITTTSGSFDSSSYIQIGKIVICRFFFALGASSAIGSSPTVTLPIAARNVANTLNTVLHLTDSGSNFYEGIGVNNASASVINLYANKTDGTYANYAVTPITATVPFTWAVNDVIAFSLTYEAA